MSRDIFIYWVICCGFLLFLLIDISISVEYIDIETEKISAEIGSKLFLPLKIRNPTDDILYAEIIVYGKYGVRVLGNDFKSIDSGISKHLILNPREAVTLNIFFVPYRIGNYDKLEKKGPHIQILLCDMTGKKNCDSYNLSDENGPLDLKIIPLWVYFRDSGGFNRETSPDIDKKKHIVLLLLACIYFLYSRYK